MSFARTKIQLPRPRVHVPRPALEARLAAALAGPHRLVLLCASAGYGKTSALAWQLAQMAQQAQQAPPPAGVAIAWIACDEDDTPMQLLQALLAALEPFDLPWRISPEALLARAAEAGTREARRALAAELINALDASEVAHGVIAIDDLHRITDPAVAEFLAYLLERGSARWTLAIATRSEPALPLARLRAAGELLELREADLRFDDTEARALAGSAVDAATFARLLERTQGWPAGLGLALASPRPGWPAPGSLPGPALSQAERAWFELISGEVIDRLPERRREFLLSTSVLPELTPARAAAVSGMADAAALLDDLARYGPFVTVIGGLHEDPDRALRLHDLFREALARRLRQERPQDLPALLKRAAAGEADDARRLHYLLAAGDWDATDAVLEERAGDMMTTGSVASLRQLLERFPPEEQQRAGVQVARGLMAWSHWDFAAMPQAMRRAAAAYRQRGLPAREATCLVYLAIALEGVADAAAMDQVLEDLRAREADLQADPVAHCRLLLARLWQALRHGRPEDVVALLEEQVARLETIESLQAWYENIPTLPMVGLPGTRTSLSRYVRGLLARAPEEPTIVRGMALVLQAWLAIHAGDWAAAERSLGLAREEDRWLAEPPSLHFQVMITEGQLLRLRGRHEALAAQLLRMARWFDEPQAGGSRRNTRPWGLHFACRLAAQAGDAALFEAHHAALCSLGPGAAEAIGPNGMAALAALQAGFAGRHDEALAGWQGLLSHTGVLAPYGQNVEWPLRAALASLALGRGPEASEAIVLACRRARADGDEGALALVGPEALERLASVAETSAPAADRELLAHWAQRARQWQRMHDAPAEETGETKCEADGVARPAKARLADRNAQEQAIGEVDEIQGTTAPIDGRLSEREADVLALIAEGQSNKVIARTLDISPHTVKRHVANILDKLGVGSRGQAAAWHRRAASGPGPG